MARILFISIPMQGHTDFGGNSFIRTASRLQELGHQTFWHTSFRSAWGRTFRKRLELSGIASVAAASMEWLIFSAQATEIVAGAVKLARYLERAKIELIVADRQCVHIPLAAQLTGIPWAAVGTDGREWNHSVVDPDRMIFGARPQKAACKAGLAAQRRLGLLGNNQELARSTWLVSPFLNLSFFPGLFWNDAGAQRISHSHFPGGSDSGRPGMVANGRKPRILLTFGNTFHPAAAGIVTKLFPKVMERLPGLTALVLAGNKRFIHSAGQAWRAARSIEVEPWGDYFDAFSESCLAIGHGGTAFLWHSMHAGIPSLVIAPARGDQIFNSEQIGRLKLGATVSLAELTVEALAGKIHFLLHDEEAQERISRFRQLLGSGGGVAAAATLIETLVDQKKPVTECPCNPCCC